MHTTHTHVYICSIYIYTHTYIRTSIDRSSSSSYRWAWTLARCRTMWHTSLSVKSRLGAKTCRMLWINGLIKVNIPHEIMDVFGFPVDFRPLKRGIIRNDLILNGAAMSPQLCRRYMLKTWNTRRSTTFGSFAARREWQFGFVWGKHFVKRKGSNLRFLEPFNIPSIRGVIVICSMGSDVLSELSDGWASWQRVIRDPSRCSVNIPGKHCPVGPEGSNQECRRLVMTPATPMSGRNHCWEWCKMMQDYSPDIHHSSPASRNPHESSMASWALAENFGF